MADFSSLLSDEPRSDVTQTSQARPVPKLTLPLLAPYQLCQRDPEPGPLDKCIATSGGRLHPYARLSHIEEEVPLFCKLPQRTALFVVYEYRSNMTILLTFLVNCSIMGERN